MTTASNHHPYAHPAWGSPANGPVWAGPPFWHPAGMSRPVGIAMMILGFVFFWPIGLAMLFLMKWSGHMGCWGRRNQSAMRDGGWAQWKAPWQNWCAPAQSATQAGTSGNRAFDEYRTETLRRLEEEQQEFTGFLDRLRFAKDKSEFDQFMAERRARPPAPPHVTEGDQPHG